MSIPADQLNQKPQSGREAATPLRFVTAASLFDGHDAAINIMRRLIQAQGAEVIHLGHNRSVLDIVRAAIQEDADAIALSSYQGGHVEYFKYMVDLLRERGAEHIRLFGGGGGTITGTCFCAPFHSRRLSLSSPSLYTSSSSAEITLAMLLASV